MILDLQSLLLVKMTIDKTGEDRRILDVDFSREESKREEIDIYVRGGVGRADTRLQRGLYRTESEQRAFIEYGLRLPLTPPARRCSLRQRFFQLLYRNI